MDKNPKSVRATLAVPARQVVAGATDPRFDAVEAELGRILSRLDALHQLVVRNESELLALRHKRTRRSRTSGCSMTLSGTFLKNFGPSWRADAASLRRTRSLLRRPEGSASSAAATAVVFESRGPTGNPRAV